MSQSIGKDTSVDNTGNMEQKSSYAIMCSAIKRDFIPTKDEMNKINSFMFTRWISNHPLGCEIANYINNHTHLPMNVQYWLVRSSMNSIKYIAQSKKSEEESNNQDLLQIIIDKYKVNYGTALKYLRILPKQELENLREMYSGGRIR